MGWAKLDDLFYDHPKIQGVGNAGAGLYVKGLTYCCRHLTDGRIPATWAKKEEAGDAGLIELLVTQGLWLDAGADETGSVYYEIPDFLDFNPSRAEVEAARAKARDKKREQRSKSPPLSRGLSPGESPGDSSGTPGTGIGVTTSTSSLEVKVDAAKQQYSQEWQDWLEHYRATTGRFARGSKEARGFFNARRDEGLTLDQLKRATVGAHSDPKMREGGYDRPETILRESKVERYINLAAQPPPPDPSEHPVDRRVRELGELAARLDAGSAG